MLSDAHRKALVELHTTCMQQTKALVVQKADGPTLILIPDALPAGALLPDTIAGSG